MRRRLLNGKGDNAYLSMASFHWSLKTSSFHSGMRLLTGHPVWVWQKGVPQSMQRAACTLRSTSSCPSSLRISFQSNTRSSGSLYGSGLR